MAEPSANDRRYFRLQYPASMQPMIAVNEQAYRVSELSEGGMRIICSVGHGLKIGDVIAGAIQFEDGEWVDVVGRVLRHHSSTETVVQLTEGVSFKQMMHEQKRVLRNCGADSIAFAANQNDQTSRAY